MKARQQKNLRQTADLILEAIEINEPRRLTVTELTRSVGRDRASVGNAIRLLKKEQLVATEFDGHGEPRYRKALFNPADVRRAA